MSAAVPAPRSYLPTLTSVRLFAALWVVVYHLAMFYAVPEGPLRSFANSGYLGVSLFFVLSGFILAHTYDARLASGHFDARGFYRARVARVYPLYLSCLALGGLQQLVALNPIQRPTLRDHPAISILLNVSLLQNWDIRTLNAINSPGWSIACEAGFYLSFPLAAKWILHLRRERLWIAAALVVVAGLVVETVAANVSRSLTSGVSVEEATVIGSRFLPFARFDEFFLGILTYRAAREISWRAFAAILLGMAIAAVVATRTLQHFAAPLVLPVSGLTGYFPSRLEATFPLLAAALFYSLVRLGGDRPHWLAHRWLEYGGKISFALYLAHFPVLSLFLPLRHANGQGRHDLVIALASVAAMFAVAALGYRFIEEPARRMLLRSTSSARSSQT